MKRRLQGYCPSCGREMKAHRNDYRPIGFGVYEVWCQACGRKHSLWIYDNGKAVADHVKRK